MEQLRNTQDGPALLSDNLAGSTQARLQGRGGDGRTWTACGISVWAMWLWRAAGPRDVLVP
jgi:hypothetical protein